jgi:hypothetical protein
MTFGGLSCWCTCPARAPAGALVDVGDARLAALARSIEPLRAPAADPNAVALPYSVPLGLGTVVVMVFLGNRGPPDATPASVARAARRWPSWAS